MTITLNAKDRKPLVKTISEFAGEKAVYMKMPTCAYQIGGYTVTREDNLITPEDMDNETVHSVIQQLATAGFQPEGAAELFEAATGSEQGEVTGLTVSIPLDKVNVGNLTNLLEAKGMLIKKALGINATPIEITEEAISFPWFETIPEPDEADTYTRLIAALCRMSREQKRISPKTADPENEKYAFRCFLLRLGFIGDEYKTARKILLHNLTGSSAWKGGASNAE